MTGKEYAMIIKMESMLSLDELCEICRISPEFIISLIEHGTLEPEGDNSHTWRFNTIQIHRIQQVIRLQDDLEVNLAGAVLALDLMDKIKTLETQLEIFEKHFAILK